MRLLISRVHWTALAIVLAQIRIGSEASELEDADRKALLTYGFVPNSIEGSGFLEEESETEAENDDFDCKSSTMTVEQRKHIPLHAHRPYEAKIALGPTEQAREDGNRAKYLLLEMGLQTGVIGSPTESNVL
ncbi:hypothetical protein COOONC_19335 [Cooperia oncophora]